MGEICMFEKHYSVRISKPKPLMSPANESTSVSVFRVACTLEGGIVIHIKCFSHSLALKHLMNI